MGNARIIARNSVLLAIAHGGSKVFSIALTAVAARLLGASGYGLYTMGSALVEVGKVIAGGGLDMIVTRETASDRGIGRRVAYHATALKLSYAVLVYGVIAAAAVLLGYPKPVLYVTLILGTAVFIELSSDTVDAVFNGNERVASSAKAFLLAAAVTFVGGSAALLGGLGLYGYCAAFVVGFLVRMVAIHWMGLRAHVIGPLHQSVDRAELRRLFRLGAPLLGAMIVSLLFHRMDILMLGVMLDEADVGRYGAAVRIIDVLVLAPRILATAAMPAMRRTLDEKGTDLTGQLVAKSLRLSLLLCSLLALGVWVMAPFALRWIASEEFVSATPTLRILSLGLVLQASSYMFARLIVAIDREHDFLRIAGLSLLSNAVLNTLWIPRYGIDGAAYATVCSYVLNASLYWFFAMRHHVRVPLLRGAGGPALALAAAYGVTLVVDGGIARALGMLGAWLVIAIGTRTLGKAELTQLREALRR